MYCVPEKRRAKHVVTLGTLATHPDYQGQGVGTRFMTTLIQLLKQKGIKRIDLCAEEDNPKALAFYQKLGFQLEGVLKQYFKRPYEDKYVNEHLLALLL
jgi:ribosomal protein S18 acetylase RimI-like enzyme